WSELGFDFEGQTQALVFESTIKKERNEFMFKQYAKGFVKNHSWSESDILKLKQLYARFTARQAAEMMGRSYKSVQSRIKLLGLNKKSGAAIKLVTDDHQIRTDRHFIASDRFDKAS
ncbi:hypothetical protein LCGC14_3133520, partial [marine sediment metagenome]